MKTRPLLCNVYLSSDNESALRTSKLQDNVSFV